MKSINITIGRQLGSGGRLIGKALAEHYSLPFYDKEILLLAARESGLQTKFFEKFDECAKRRFMGLFYVESPIASPAIFKFQSDVIREKAKQGGVFVGRCADYILRDHPNLLRIFISANEADRIKLITKYNDVTPEVAAKQMLTADSARADYYNFYTTKQWGVASSYDICLNSSVCGGIDKTVALLINIIDQVI